MDAIIGGVVVYIFLLLIFRISGKRTLAQITNFDLVLLLIISETTQQAMVDSDHSITNGFLLITTLVAVSILFSIIKQKFPKFEKIIDGTPVIVIENGKLLRDRMDKLRVDEDDILEAARELQGIERLEQIKYAIVEKGGDITVIPQKT